MLLLFDGDLGARETLRFIEEKLGAGIWECIASAPADR
jgi:hypothetical protein